jgi:hypothetical protein
MPYHPRPHIDGTAFWKQRGEAIEDRITEVHGGAREADYWLVDLARYGRCVVHQVNSRWVVDQTDEAEAEADSL